MGAVSGPGSGAGTLAQPGSPSTGASLAGSTTKAPTDNADNTQGQNQTPAQRAAAMGQTSTATASPGQANITGGGSLTGNSIFSSLNPPPTTEPTLTAPVTASVLAAPKSITPPITPESFTSYYGSSATKELTGDAATQYAQSNGLTPQQLQQYQQTGSVTLTASPASFLNQATGQTESYTGIQTPSTLPPNSLTGQAATSYLQTQGGTPDQVAQYKATGMVTLTPSPTLFTNGATGGTSSYTGISTLPTPVTSPGYQPTSSVTSSSGVIIGGTPATVPTGIVPGSVVQNDLYNYTVTVQLADGQTIPNVSVNVPTTYLPELMAQGTASPIISEIALDNLNGATLSYGPATTTASATPTTQTVNVDTLLANSGIGSGYTFNTNPGSPVPTLTIQYSPSGQAEGFVGAWTPYANDPLLSSVPSLTASAEGYTFSIVNGQILIIQNGQNVGNANLALLSGGATTPAQGVQGGGIAAELGNALSTAKPEATSVTLANGQVVQLQPPTQYGPNGVQYLNAPPAASSPLAFLVSSQNLGQLSPNGQAAQYPQSATSAGVPSNNSLPSQNLLQYTLGSNINNFLNGISTWFKQQAQTPYNPSDLNGAYLQANLLGLPYSGYEYLKGGPIKGYINVQNQMNQLVQQGAVPWYFPDVANLLISVPLIATGLAAGPAIASTGATVPQALTEGAFLKNVLTGSLGYAGFNAAYDYLTGQPITKQNITQNLVTGETVAAITSPLSGLTTPILTKLGTWVGALGAGSPAAEILASQETEPVWATLAAQLVTKSPEVIQEGINVANFLATATAVQSLNNGTAPTVKALQTSWLVGFMLGTSIPLGSILGSGFAAAAESLELPDAVGGIARAATALSLPGAANAATGLATGSQLSSGVNFAIGAAIPAFGEFAKSAGGSLETTARQGLGAEGFVPEQGISYATPVEQILNQVVNLLPNDQKQLLAIVERGAKSAGYELPAEVSSFTAQQLKEVLTFNPKLFQGAGEIFTTTIPKSVFLNDIQFGYVSEELADNALKAANIDTTGLDYKQKLDALYNVIKTRPAPTYIQTQGFTLANSYEFALNDIRRALGQGSTVPTGVLPIHISPEEELYKATARGQVAGIKPTGVEDWTKRYLYGLSGRSMYESAPGIDITTGEPTALAYNYGGAFGREAENTGTGSSGIQGKYYGQVQPFVSYSADWLEREQFAKQTNYQYGDPARQASYIQSTGQIPDQARNADFRYTVDAAKAGKNIQTPIPAYLNQGELENAAPALGSLKGGTPFDIVTVRTNQGIFQNVPLLENLFPDFTRGAFRTTYLQPATTQEITQRLKSGFKQEFEAVKTSNIEKAIDNYQPFERDAGRVIINNPDKGILLIHETGRPTWSLPGGGIKEGENPVAASLREAQEETGISADPSNAKEVLLGQVGKVKTFIKSGADFYDKTNTYAIDSTKQPSLDNKEVDSYLYYKPGLNVRLAPDAYTQIQKYYADKGIDINQWNTVAAPKQIRTVVFDLDNTLVGDNGQLRPNALTLLDYLKNNGIEVKLFTHSTYDRANGILQNTGLSNYFNIDNHNQVVTREGYANGQPMHAFKDISKIGGDVLVDDNPLQIDQQAAAGRYAIKTTTYRGGGSGDLLNVLNTLRALTTTSPDVSVVEPIKTAEQLNEKAAEARTASRYRAQGSGEEATPGYAYSSAPFGYRGSSPSYASQPSYPSYITPGSELETVPSSYRPTYASSSQPSPSYLSEPSYSQPSYSYNPSYPSYLEEPYYPSPKEEYYEVPPYKRAQPPPPTPYLGANVPAKEALPGGNLLTSYQTQYAPSLTTTLIPQLTPNITNPDTAILGVGLRGAYQAPGLDNPTSGVPTPSDTALQEAIQNAQLGAISPDLLSTPPQTASQPQSLANAQITQENANLTQPATPSSPSYLQNPQYYGELEQSLLQQQNANLVQDASRNYQNSLFGQGILQNLGQGMSFTDLQALIKSQEDLANAQYNAQSQPSLAEEAANIPSAYANQNVYAQVPAEVRRRLEDVGVEVPQPAYA